MKNFVQKGDVIVVTAPEDGITSGDIVVAGAFVGVAASTAAEGDSVAVNLEGVFEVGKTAALEITQGDALFVDTTTGLVTKTATDKPLGAAFEDAAGADTTCLVKLQSQKVASVQAENVDAITTANGSDAGTTQALANATKTTVNAIITALVEAGIMAEE
jgi:predicted RecA/RadA family phage recombinase